MIRSFAFGEAPAIRETSGITSGDHRTPHQLVWVDLSEPTADEIALLHTLWGFHPLAVEDCRNTQRRAKIERYATHDFVVVQALDPHTELPLDTLSIRIFIRSNLLVTVHDKPVPAIERVVGNTRSGELSPDCTYGHLVHQLLDAVIDEYMPLLDQYEVELEDLEARCSTNPDHELLDTIIGVRHDLLIMKRLFLPHEEVIRRLMDRQDLSEETRLYYRDVLDHLMVVGDTVTLLLDVASGAMQVHNSTTNDRLNKVMKYLAVISTLMLPMTVISGVFGMNFEVIPVTHQVWGFWAALGMMAFSAILLVAWFKYKKWF